MGSGSLDHPHRPKPIRRGKTLSQHRAITREHHAVCFALSSLNAADTRPRIVTSFLPLHFWTTKFLGNMRAWKTFYPPAPSRTTTRSPSATRASSNAQTSSSSTVSAGSMAAEVSRELGKGKDHVVTISLGWSRTSSRANMGTAPSRHDHQHRQPARVARSATRGARRERFLVWRCSVLIPQTPRLTPRTRNVTSQDSNNSIATFSKRSPGATNRAIVTYHDAFPYLLDATD